MWIFCSLWVLACPADPIRREGLIAEESVGSIQARAEELLRRGEADGAIPLFRKVVQVQPHNEPARFGLARALLFSTGGGGVVYRRGLAEAASLFEASTVLLEPIPGEGRSTALRFFYLGLARWYLDQGEAALTAFDRAFQLDSALTPALFNAIRVAEEMGRKGEALRRKQTYLRTATPTRQ